MSEIPKQYKRPLLMVDITYTISTDMQPKLQEKNLKLSSKKCEKLAKKSQQLFDRFKTIIEEIDKDEKEG